MPQASFHRRKAFNDNRGPLPPATPYTDFERDSSTTTTPQPQTTRTARRAAWRAKWKAEVDRAIELRDFATDEIRLSGGSGRLPDTGILEELAKFSRSRPARGDVTLGFTKAEDADEYLRDRSTYHELLGRVLQSVDVEEGEFSMFVQPFDISAEEIDDAHREEKCRHAYPSCRAMGSRLSQLGDKIGALLEGESPETFACLEETLKGVSKCHEFAMGKTFDEFLDQNEAFTALYDSAEASLQLLFDRCPEAKRGAFTEAWTDMFAQILPKSGSEEM